MKDSRKILRSRRCCLFEETNYARVWAKARAEPKDKLETYENNICNLKIMRGMANDESRELLMKAKALEEATAKL